MESIPRPSLKPASTRGPVSGAGGYASRGRFSRGVRSLRRSGCPACVFLPPSRPAPASPVCSCATPRWGLRCTIADEGAGKREGHGGPGAVCGGGPQGQGGAVPDGVAHEGGVPGSAEGRRRRVQGGGRGQEGEEVEGERQQVRGDQHLPQGRGQVSARRGGGGGEAVSFVRRASDEGSRARREGVPRQTWVCRGLGRVACSPCVCPRLCRVTLYVA